jgi:hypothetical protein
VFLDIHHLFISWISEDLDIKNQKICLPIMLGASLWLLGEKSPKGSILFLKEIFCHNFFFVKNIRKNHK